jgi:NAD(P)-dependent dehydrogenase (short-subunit alcohol dehydrogenase family)
MRRVSLQANLLILSLNHLARRSDEKALSNAIHAGASHYHRIDGLVLNAGTIDPICRVDSTPLDAWKNNFDVNFFSLVTACKVALPFLRKSAFGGKIIFVSSGAAVKGLASWGPYNASKAAMNSLCRYLVSHHFVC